MKKSTSDLALDQLLKTALEACDGAKEILGRHFGNLRNVSEKFHAGLVSDADRESEKFIVDTILKHYPDHAILGEESGLTEGSPDRGASDGAFWMIDPLDGTTNFVHQLPYFCISIGLELHGELVLGVVDAPRLGMRFTAIKGRGAFMNGEPIHVSKRTSFSEGLFSTGFSPFDDTIDVQLALCAQTVREGRGLRRCGAAALDLCFVAQGTYDVFWETNLSPWDLAAGVAICNEAGGKATALDGTPFPSRGTSVICGSPIMHGEISKRWQALRSR